MSAQPVFRPVQGRPDRSKAVNALSFGAKQVGNCRDLAAWIPHEPSNYKRSSQEHEGAGANGPENIYTNDPDQDERADAKDDSRDASE